MKIVWCIALVGVLSCGNHRLEKDFFKHDRDQRVARMENYSIEDQYRIFRYGNDKVEPPMLELAIPLARRGARIVPFLSEQLEISHDDEAVVDILSVFRTMAQLRTYRLQKNSELDSSLRHRIARMKDRYWQAFCTDELGKIEQSDGQPH